MNAIIIIEEFKTKKYVIFLSLTESENKSTTHCDKKRCFQTCSECLKGINEMEFLIIQSIRTWFKKNWVYILALCSFNQSI